MATETAIAWAAGLFEGEGHFSVVKQRRRLDDVESISALAGLVSTDHDVITRFHAIVGVGNVTVRDRPDPRHKRQWIWQAAAIEDVRAIVRLFSPWFCSRRAAKAQEVLAAYESAPVRRYSKTHCPNGHERSPENTLMVSGYPRCRECNRTTYRKGRHTDHVHVATLDTTGG